MAFPTTTVAADTGDAAFTKRVDDVAELVLVADDDADSKDNTRSRDTRLPNSRATNDKARSNFTQMSRDHDHSRGDKTAQSAFGATCA